MATEPLRGCLLPVARVRRPRAVPAAQAQPPRAEPHSQPISAPARSARSAPRGPQRRHGDARRGQGGGNEEMQPAVRGRHHHLAHKKIDARPLASFARKRHVFKLGLFGMPATPTARLAQSAERKTLNLVVVGSSPTLGDHYWYAQGFLGTVFFLPLLLLDPFPSRKGRNNKQEQGITERSQQ